MALVGTSGPGLLVMPVRTVDLFCGAGGSSWGARLAGADIVAGVDMSSLAGEVFSENFPQARFYCSRLEDLVPKRLGDQVGPVDLLLASPECTNHSPAKGPGPRCERSRETAFQVIRFARALSPRWIVVENVVNIRNWSRYEEFTGALQSLGYHVNPLADRFGVPTSRRRLFILCDREREPRSVSPTRHVRVRPAREVVDLDGRYKWSPLRSPRRAAATIERADRAIAALGRREPFLLVYYGSDHAGGWQTLDVPLRTITTVDRFAIVRAAKRGHEMRMLQVPELKAAMGFPRRFVLPGGTRREQIHMIGNAVCPRVMQASIRALIRNPGQSA